MSLVDFVDGTVSIPANGSELNRIEPGSRDDSYLYRKISGTQAEVGGGRQMPRLRDPLDDETIERIGLYIDSLAE